MALQRFIRRAGEAAKGTGEAKAALKDLGIQLKNNDGTLRDTRDILFDVAEGIKNTTSPAEQLRLAFKFFDSEGAALVNTLKDGRAGLEEFERKAQSLGFVLDQQTISATEEFNNNIATIRRQITGFVQYTLTAFLPVLDEMAKKMSETLGEVAQRPGGFKELGKTIAITIINAMEVATVAIYSFLNRAKIEMLKFYAAIPGMAKNLDPLQKKFLEYDNALKEFTRQQEIINDPKYSKFFKENPKALQEGIKKLWEYGGNVRALREELEKGGFDFGDEQSIVGFFDRARKLIADGFDVVSKESQKGSEKAILPAIETFVQGIGTVQENLGSAAVGAMKKFEDSIVDGLKKGKLSFQDFSNYVVEQLLRIAIQQAILKPLSGVFGDFFSGFGDMFRASGGAVNQGSPYIVGERGAEMFVPNSSGQIITNENLQKMQSGRASAPIVNFNISTVDAAGFDELLASRKNLITAIINNAMNSKGKLGVI